MTLRSSYGIHALMYKEWLGQPGNIRPEQWERVWTSGSNSYLSSCFNAYLVPQGGKHFFCAVWQAGLNWVPAVLQSTPSADECGTALTAWLKEFLGALEGHKHNPLTIAA